jgi:hypothetical protein
MDALRATEANDAVLAYLESEQHPSWRTSDSPWIKDGYALVTHPDLCEFLASIDERAGANTTFRYLYGKPALIAMNDVVVAFAQGTHIVCVRLPRDLCDADFVDARDDPVPNHPLLRAKRRELERLVAGDWTRIDPWRTGFEREERDARVSALLERAVSRAHAS